MLAPHVKPGEPIQLEVVSGGGAPIVTHPIDIQEILRQQNLTMDLGNGVSVRLEEATLSQEDYSEESEETGDSKVSQPEQQYLGKEQLYVPPAGTQVVDEWYSVLNALRQESSSQQRGRAHGATEATPLRVFPTERYVPDEQAKGAEKSAQSRRDIWASYAPPTDAERNYNRLQQTNIMGIANSRQFRPPALSHHAMASYLNLNDKGQRLLVYGGISHQGKAVQHEIYEFSLLSGSWRRLEGKQFVPAGHYAHTMAVVETLGRLVVIGGIGPGGVSVSKEHAASDPQKALRAKLLFPKNISTAAEASTRLANLPAGGRAMSTMLCEPTPKRPTVAIGFVPYIFDMDVNSHRWRAVRPPEAFPIAFHTAVAFKKEVYVFGGITGSLSVSGQLIAVNVETYATRLVKPALLMPTNVVEAGGPEPRYLHSAVRYGHYMVVFGGYNSENEPMGDTFAFDFINERWEKLNCNPDVGPRAGHAACVVGCRLIVVGGFECALGELQPGNVLSTVSCLNLVPNMTGEYRWHASVPIRPPLPPLAVAATTPCGDDASFIVIGGLTVKPKRKGRAHAHGALDDGCTRFRSASVQHRQVNHSRSRSYSPPLATARSDDGDEDSSPYANLQVEADGRVLTFPYKPLRKSEDEAVAGGHVNELGIEVDPDEVPEHFQAFVRRQEDFIRKKNGTIAETIRKITLDERESMEPALYLTGDEISFLIGKSESCCDGFSAFKAESLPSNVPERETRLRIMEECISLSRQVRDIMKSMKGAEPGVTAVKSKTHRRRTGQKFEEHSAAKPLRRVVIGNLIAAINDQLGGMHRMNRTLQTVEWPEKEEFLQTIQDLQGKVDNLTRAIGSVVGKYIRHRVGLLMKGVEKHKEVMRRLAEEVNKNRQDRIFRSDAPDPQRERVKRTWAGGKPVKTESLTPPRAVARRSASHRSRAIGAGYYVDEEKASIVLMNREWNALMEMAKRVEMSATAFSSYCCQSVSKEGPSEVAETALTAAALTTGVHFSGLTVPGPPVAGLLQIPPSPALMLEPPPLSLPGATPDQPIPAAAVGDASARSAVVKRSNELRRRAADAAIEVSHAVHTFGETMERQLPPPRDVERDPVSEASPPPGAMDGAPFTSSIPLSPATNDGPFPHLLVVPPPLVSPINAIGAPTQEVTGARASKSSDATLLPPNSVPNTLYLSQLRPLLECKSKLAGVAKVIGGIRMNEWDLSDPTGAPADEKAVKLFRFMQRGLSALVQSVTASFLSKAGAKPPHRTLTTSVETKPQVAPATKKSTKRAPRSQRGRGIPKSHSSSRSSSGSYSSSFTGECSSSYSGSSATVRIHKSEVRRTIESKHHESTNDVPSGARASAPMKLPALPVSLTIPLDNSVYLSRLPEGPGVCTISSGHVAVEQAVKASRTIPLVSCEMSLLMPATTTGERVVNASVPDATSPLAIIVPSQSEVVAIANDSVAATCTNYSPHLYGFAEHTSAKRFANDWAMSPSEPRCIERVPLHASSPGAPTVLDGITVARGPVVEAPQSNFISPEGSFARRERRSTILDLAHPSGGDHAASPYDAPITSVSPGPFVVNPDNFYLGAVGGGHAHQQKDTTSAVPTELAAQPASHWADADEDYFYFGRPVHRALASQCAQHCLPSSSRGETQAGVHSAGSSRLQRKPRPVEISPTVGSVVSTRGHAELGPVSSKPWDNKRPSTARERSISQGAARGCGPHNIKGQGAGSSVAARGPHTRSRLTPGELQILQAKERLGRR